MTAKAYLILVLFLVWSAFSWWWYTCKIKNLCPESIFQTTAVADKNTQGDQIESKISGDSNELSETVENANTEKENEGHSNLGETNPEEGGSGMDDQTSVNGLADSEVQTSTENSQSTDGRQADLGNERENSTGASDQNTATDELGNEQSGSTDTGNESMENEEDNVDNATEATSGNVETEGDPNSELNTGSNDNSSEDSTSSSDNSNANTIVRLEDKTIIYFEYLSDVPQLNDQAQNFLNQIANDLNNDIYKSIRVTGYTDNIGNPKNNYYKGLDRARAIQSYLMNNGARENQVELKSFGEYRPVADNSTDEGRSKKFCA